MARCTMLLLVILSLLSANAMAGPTETAAQAKAALAAGNSTLAASLFEEIVSLHPDSPQAPNAALKRAYLALRLDEPNPDDLFLRAATRYSTTQQAADALRRLGYISQSKGELDAAQDYFNQAADHPRQSEIGRAESLVHYAFLDVSKYFAAGLPDKPGCDGKSAVPPERKAEAADRLEQARVKFNAATNRMGVSPRTAVYASFAQAGIGETYILEQRWADAENAYRAGLELSAKLPSPLEALLHHGLGIALQRQARLPEALEELDAALRLASTRGGFLGSGISTSKINADAACVKSMILISQKKPDEAVAVLSQVLEEYAQNRPTRVAPDEWFARVAGWRVIALSRAGRLAERNAALRDMLAKYAGTQAAAVAATWMQKHGWG